MSNTWRLAIAGLGVEMVLPDPSWESVLESRWGAFRGEGPSTWLPLKVSLAPSGGAPGGEPRVEAQGPGHWRLRHDEFEADLGPDGGELRVHAPSLHMPEDGLHFMALDSAMRIMLTEALAKRGGMLMHAAGFQVGDRGFVGFGPSGAGKTTLCGLAEGQAKVLCDEVIAVAPGPGGFWLHSTPFYGAWGRSSPGSLPLGGLARLRHAPEHSWRPMPPGRAVGDLLESAIAYGAQAEVALSRLEIATSLMASTPVGELAFAPQPDVWGTIREAIGS